MLNNIKHFLSKDTNFIALLIILVAFASYGLGRLSVVEPKVEGTVRLIESDMAANVLPEVSAVSEAQYVGSVNGTKFHLLTCPGASQINEDNKLYFSTKEEAYSKGYTEAANCKF